MKKLFVYTAALAALILFPKFIGAQTLNWDATNADTIENNIGDVSAAPQIVISGDKAVTVWGQSDGSNSRIYSNYSTDAGATWKDTQLIDNNAGDAWGSQIAISGSNVVAVWYQNYRIYSNYSKDGGATWAGAQRIDNIESQAANPQIVISGDTVVAAWQQSDGSRYRIYANYATISAGAVVWDTTNADTVSSDIGVAQVPQIAISGDTHGDTVVVVWQQHNDGDGHDRIYSNYAAIDGTGAVAWDPANAKTIEDINYYADAPQIAASRNTVVVVWQQEDSSNYYHIYSNYSTDNGATWNSEQPVEDFADSSDVPQIAASGNTVVVVWQQEDSSGYYHIYSNYSTDGGATWILDSGQLIDNIADQNAQEPQIAISGANVAAVWVQNDGSSGGYDRIYSNYSTIDGTGAVIWDATNVDTVSNGDAGGDHPQIAISGYKAVAVWEQLAAGNNLPASIYSNYAQVVPESITGDSGSLPVGPLAAGISAFLVWWKRRKQRQG